MFGNTTPNYLYELLKELEYQEIKLCDYVEDMDEDEQTYVIEIPYV